MMRTTKVLDGNAAAARVAYAFSDVAFVYPITPATPMAEQVEKLSSAHHKNAFGQVVAVNEMQSEAGVAGAMHGSLVAGGLASTFTASQGLLLMIPNLYKMAAEHLPGVIYVASRTVATHALSIFGDHSDVYATRQTGVSIFSASSVQEVVDLAPAAHMAALVGKMPVVFFFDGFRTSHETQKVDVWSEADLANMLPLEAIAAFKNNALNPNHPRVMGSAQNPDTFFQVREASNLNYLALPEVFDLQLAKINSAIGTNYKPYEYYGAVDAQHIIVAMGSVVDTIKQTVDYLNSIGKKVGVLNVRLFRPFSTSKFIEAIPKTVTQISVLDRSKEPGATGEPLYMDVVCALAASAAHSSISINRGRYGLSSKDTTPENIISVFENVEKREFTIGITDDVTNLSLEPAKPLGLDTKQHTCCKFFGRGADGTIGSVKAAGKIIGQHTHNFVQVYAQHDSKTAGALTTSHLRFGKTPVHEPYLVRKAHFVACNNFTDFEKYNLYENLLDGADLLLNCPYTVKELDAKLSGVAKQYLASHNIKLHIIDASGLCRKIGLGKHVNTMLITAAFCIMNLMPAENCAKLLKQYVHDAYSAYGNKVLQANESAIDCARENLCEVNILASWANADTLVNSNGADTATIAPIAPSDTFSNTYASTIQAQVLRNKGNKIPVSAFVPFADGSAPSGTTANEKPGAAVRVVSWNPKECMQCNHCAFVCPAAAIRPYALSKQEANAAPVDLKHTPLTGNSAFEFAIGVSVMDCTGCATCISKCPCAGKALRLGKLENEKSEQTAFDFLETLPKKEEIEVLFRPTSVKGSQFKKPLMEFAPACPGCGEAPYAKLLTQLFGERMYIANATGCSSIWGNTSPSTPYTTNSTGAGPVWSNSLFEDAAEFGFGMLLAQNHARQALKPRLQKLSSNPACDKGLQGAIKAWLQSYSYGHANAVATELLCKRLKQSNLPEATEILKHESELSKKSQWVFGGDGWAYDIGFGGLDHILASGQDINIIVFDTQCYSNTGGQASKATPRGAMAKLCSNGKTTPKKNLAAIACSYKNVYVASIAMGADMNQCIKAMIEAEAHEGPSILLAYAACKHHGLNSSAHTQIEEEKAVQCGYWNLFRYNPANANNKTGGLEVDAAADTSKLEKFLAREARYSKENYSSTDVANEMFNELKNDVLLEDMSLNKTTKN